jgi:hypothetical protein
MLYNVKFVADGDDVNDVVFENDKARAEHIVARIDAQLAELDPDIIVFNEAFDEEAQDVFSSGLCDTHPFFSRFIDEEDDDQHQDSGLMLFSRHPFAALNLTEADFEARDHLTFTGCVDADADEDDPAYWDDIGFQLYLNCNYVFEDCSANKGIAAARFSHRSTGELFNILFTHLQSGGGDDERETRVHQMADIRELVEAVPDWEAQRTFILGDLNVAGIGCSAAGCVPDAGGEEWIEHFDAAGGFFACGDGECTETSAFVDSHGFEMPPTDFGRTFHGDDVTFLEPLNGNRYDYVLHNVPEERWTCMQHFQVLREAVLDPDGTPVSDHYPVLADFNWRAPHCSPVTAAPMVDSPVHTHGGAITYPKSVQWLVLQKAGTYSIEAPSDIRFEVFPGTDLSDPVSADPEEFQERWTTFRLPEPPYYVKVRASDADPLATGPYSLRVIEHECGEQDPCGLTPGDVDGVTASWTSQSVVGTSSRWFFFDTEVSETGARPEIDIHVEGVCTAGFEAFLYDEDGNTVPWTSVEVGNVLTTLTASADDLPSGRYRVEVHRVDNGDQAPCTMNVQYLTTLTYVRFGTLVCVDETGGSGGPAEEIGHDEIWHRFDLDGSYPNGSCLTTSDLGEFSHLRDFDEDDAKTLNLDGKLGQRVYVDCWLLELLEADDVSEGDVHHLNDDERVFTLDRERRTDTRDLKWDAGDYEYRLRYTLSHEPDPK